MQRRLAIGARWEEKLVERLSANLPGWTVSSEVDLATAARAAAVLIPFGMRVDRELLAGSSIRLIQQFGVGLDNVDLQAARELGIAVTNAPSEVSGMAASVAEGAISLLLSCARLPSARTANLAAGKWNWTTPLNLGLAGKTAGLVGLGSIGKAIATRLAAFDMRLRAVRRSGAGGDPTPAGFDWVGGAERMEELVSTSDFLIICVPLTPETENLFDSSLMARIRSGTSIVNVGRGAIVDEKALIAALDSGRLHAAGLDTLRKEPPEEDSPLLRHPRIVVTPHDAGVTEVAFDGVTRIIARNLAHLEAHEPLEHRVV